MYSAALLSVNRRARATQMDWPHINEAAQETMDANGFADRFFRVDGNFYDAKFGDENFDYVVVSNIIHQESPQSVAHLFEKSARSLKRGGRIIVSDWIVDDGRTGPSSALFFNFTMLLLSPDGRTYEREDVQRMLQAAGIADVEFIETDDYETVVSGVKTGS